MPERPDTNELRESVAAELAAESRRSPEHEEREAFAEAAGLLNDAEAAAARALAEGERARSHALEPDHPDHRRGVKISLDPALERKFRTAARDIKEAVTDLRQRISYALSLGSPFLPGEEFNARASWSRARHSPKEERARNVQEFKEKAHYQREGMVLLEEDIRAVIREDPDIGYKGLADMFEDRAESLGLGAQERKLAKNILLEYSHRHAMVRRYGEKFKDSSEGLYEEVFGRRPQGAVKVFEFPMTLHFRCEDKDDLEHLLRASMKPSTKEAEEDLKGSLACAGVYLGDAPIPELKGGLTASLAAGPDITEEDVATMAHEARHAWNRLFMRHDAGVWLRPGRGMTKAEGHAIVLDNMRRMRKEIEDMAKDEIAALLEEKQGDEELSIPAIFRIMNAAAEDGGGYDYFLRLGMRAEVHSFDPHVSDEDIDLVFRKEYRRILDDVQYACNELRLRGWSRSKIGGFLRTVDLADARAAARHELDAKRTVPDV
jgi:hypothetical protein